MNTLSKKEYEIMELFWHTDKSLSINDIMASAPWLNRNATQGVLKKLLNSGWIEISSRRQSQAAQNVYERCYLPVISQAQYIQDSLNHDSLRSLASFFVKKASTEELKDLKRLVDAHLKEAEDT